MAKFDLTSRIGQYLDRHLVFPLLEFLSAKETYDENELLKAKLDILSKTNMVDYAIDIRKQLYPKDDVPEELKSRRIHVVSQLQELQNVVEPILTIMSNDEVMKNMETMRDSKTLINFLSKDYNFEIEKIEILHKLAKYRYECGNYSVSTSYLYFCMLVLPPTDKNYLSVLWGKLASEILVQNWDSALEDLTKLREYIDSNTFGSSLQLLQQRTWLIHWSLFVFFNHVIGRDYIIDMFLYRPHYLNAIQTMCPHILRYLATAVIINRSRRSALKDLVKVIQQESYTYKDPITEFLEHLYVNFDFDGARQKLHECQIVLYNDFFLISCLDEFVENARLMIFETFCRIHQCISIGMLAEKLNMNPEEAECWIVNLIRNARLDAKIDSKLGHVVMGTQPLSPYQQLIEKIDSLSVRSEALSALIERKLKAKNDIWKRWVANKNAGGQDRLNTVITSILLRRTKAQLQTQGALQSLPEKKFEVIEVSLDNAEKKIYEKVLVFSRTLFIQFLRQRAERNHEFSNIKGGDLTQTNDEEYNKMHKKIMQMHGNTEVKSHEILVLLLRLRQICCHPSLISSMLDQEDCAAEGIEDGGVDIELLDKLDNLNLDDETENPTPDGEKASFTTQANKVLSSSNPVFAEQRANEKLRVIQKIIEEKVLTNDDKIIIVSQWTSMLNVIMRHLKGLKIKCDILDGKVPVNKRNDIVHFFAFVNFFKI